MRDLVDDVFVRLVLRVDEERRAAALVAALRRMLWTPGNPPLSVPGEGDGIMGALGRRVFDRRHAPLSLCSPRRPGAARATAIAAAAT